MAPSAPPEQLRFLLRNTAEVVTPAELEHKLARSARTGQPLRVKLGIDATGRDLTLGHTVPLRKLRAFQELGHQVVLVIGDYTGTVGDPTDRSAARRQLTLAETRENAAIYLQQAARAGLDVGAAEVRYNSEWLAPMQFADVIRLAAGMTVARMLEREDFGRRYAGGSPIHIHEFFYPLMQGYDSVAIGADVELGGRDQLFNLLVGRDLQRDAGQEPQVCLTVPLVEGIDGHRKMGKSEGNYIAVADPPAEKFGKTMSIPDFLILRYFTLLTDVPPAEIESMAAAMAAGANPMQFKLRLAQEIVHLYDGAAAAQAAGAHFQALFQRRELPGDLPELPVSPADLPVDGTVPLFRLLVLTGLAPSAGAGRRLCQQGGVSVDGRRETDPMAEVAAGAGPVLRVGKRHFGRVTVR